MCSIRRPSPTIVIVKAPPTRTSASTSAWPTGVSHTAIDAGVVHAERVVADELGRRRVGTRRLPQLVDLALEPAMADGARHVYLLDEIQIVREWRSRGIGSAIVRDLMDQAKAARKPLRLQVLKLNTRARELYARLGLRVVSESSTHHLMTYVPGDDGPNA